MATARSFDEFARNLNRRAERLQKNAEDATRASAIAIVETAVLTTPVDTGQARGGWIATIGGPSFAEGGIDPVGGGTIGAATAVVGGWREGAGAIFIANNVAHIVPLNNGSSAQAPQGMVEQALLAGQRAYRSIKLLG